MDSLNVVALTGTLERHPVMRFDPASGTARCSATLRCEDLNASGTSFKLYVPLEAWAKTAEALGACPRKKLLKNNALEIRRADFKISRFPETRILTGGWHFSIFLENS